jgi:hypothetical protein
VLSLVAPTLFVDRGPGTWLPWAAAGGALLAAVGFVLRERSARYPLLDLHLIALPLVSSGLAYKAATGLAVAGLSYMVTLQLQFAWGWSPALASVGMLPQVVVLIAGGSFVGPFVRRVGMDTAAWIGAASVVVGLAVFALFSSVGYPAVAAALVLVAAGLRVVGVVAATNVLTGLPANRTTIGAALVDTSSEVATGIGIAITGTVLAALFTGTLTGAHWSAPQAAEFQQAITVSGIALTAVAAALVAVGVIRSRRGPGTPAEASPAAPGGPANDASAE